MNVVFADVLVDGCGDGVVSVVNDDDDDDDV